MSPEQFRDRNGQCATLEFFCASRFKSQFEAKQELTFDQLFSEVFDAHASEPAWHEVLRLLAGAIDSRFTARIVDRLIDADGETTGQPWRLAVPLLAFAELRRPAPFVEQGRKLLLHVCQVFEADTQSTPRLFRFIKRHIVPPAIAMGTQWPERQVLSRVLKGPWKLRRAGRVGRHNSGSGGQSWSRGSQSCDDRLDRTEGLLGDDQPFAGSMFHGTDGLTVFVINHI